MLVYITFKSVVNGAKTKNGLKLEAAENGKTNSGGFGRNDLEKRWVTRRGREIGE